MAPAVKPARTPSDRVVSDPVSSRHLLLASVVLLVVTSARAADYGAEINVDSEDDLYDLHASGVLDDDDFETLVDLFDSGVDLNTATRDDLYALPGLTYAQADAIIEYRKLDGFIEDPLALVQAGVFTQKELEQIAPFIVIRQKGIPPGPRDIHAQIQRAPFEQRRPFLLIDQRREFGPEPFGYKAGSRSPVAIADRVRPARLAE